MLGTVASNTVTSLDKSQLQPNFLAQFFFPSRWRHNDITNFSQNNILFWMITWVLQHWRATKAPYIFNQRNCNCPWLLFLFGFNVTRNIFDQIFDKNTRLLILVDQSSTVSLQGPLDRLPYGKHPWVFHRWLTLKKSTWSRVLRIHQQGLTLCQQGKDLKLRVFWSQRCGSDPWKVGKTDDKTSYDIKLYFENL